MAKTAAERGRDYRDKQRSRINLLEAAVANSNGNGNGAASDQEVLNAAVLTRSHFVNRLLDPRRSINDECGYPETGEITTQNYRDLYDRSAIATRVVELLPQESWMMPPTIFETEEPDDETEFELAWKELNNQIRGESWYQDEEGSPIWEHLQRADKLSGVGSFGVILLGLNDGKDMEEPVDGLTFIGTATTGTPKARKTKNRKLLFLRTFDESQIEISRFEGDLRNPRFGQPIVYDITMNDPADTKQTGIGLTTSTRKVHWSRIVHVADNLSSSDVFGVPRMRPVYNRLLDLRKLYGGSGEMYWRGAFPGYSFETHPSLGGDVTIDKKATRLQAEQYMNTLQRYILSEGLTVKSLAPQVVDPTPQINVQIEAICIVLNCPKRKFVGSERGELSSDQDDADWNDRLRQRQNGYITPRIIVPVIDRLIMLGVLPQPTGYSVVWPDLDALSAQEAAEVALIRTDAMSKYVAGGVESLMPPMFYLTDELGKTDEEADAILKEAVVLIEEQEEKEFKEKEDDRDFESGQAQEGRDFDMKMEKFKATSNVDETVNKAVLDFNLSPTEAAQARALYEKELGDDDNRD